MNWRELLGVGIACWVTVGCQAQQPRPDPPGLTLGRPIPDDLGQARSQKPDGDAIKPVGVRNVLDLSPERQDSAGKGIVKARIQATVNGVPILDEEVMEASYPAILSLQSKRLPAEQYDKVVAEIYAAQLQELVNRELLMQDAFAKINKGGASTLDKLKQAADREFDQLIRKRRLELRIKTEEEFRRMLKEQGISLEGMRRQHERNFLAHEYLRYLVTNRLDDAVGHGELVAYYKQHPEEFIGRDTVEWQDLFIDPSNPRYHGSREEARAFAEQIVARLRKGELFGSFVQFDDGDSKTRDGLGMGKLHGEVQPTEAEPMLFEMKDGEVGSVIELPGGFHVIKLVHREHAGQRPFDERVQNEIRDKLRADIGSREIKAILRQLKDRSVIEIAGAK